MYNYAGFVSLHSLICIVANLKVNTVVCSHRNSKCRGVGSTVTVVGGSSVSIFQKKETAGASYNVTLITTTKHPGIGWGSVYDTPAKNNLKCLKTCVS